jgi:serine acetyltransferase
VAFAQPCAEGLTRPDIAPEKDIGYALGKLKSEHVAGWIEMELRAALVGLATILALAGGGVCLVAVAWVCLAVPALVLLARRHRHRGSWWALYVLGLHAALAPAYRSLRPAGGAPSAVSRLISLFYQLLTVPVGAEIPLGTKIGDGLLLGHTAGIVMNSLAVVGEDCVITPGVVLGSDGRDAAPVIGRNVYIGANAVIVGSSVIGDHATIGAGATVVSRDIPSCALVAGNPGVVVKENYRRSYHNSVKENECE